MVPLIVSLRTNGLFLSRPTELVVQIRQFWIEKGGADLRCGAGDSLLEDVAQLLDLHLQHLPRGITGYEPRYSKREEGMDMYVYMYTERGGRRKCVCV